MMADLSSDMILAVGVPLVGSSPPGIKQASSKGIQSVEWSGGGGGL